MLLSTSHPKAKYQRYQTQHNSATDSNDQIAILNTDNSVQIENIKIA